MPQTDVGIGRPLIEVMLCLPAHFLSLLLENNLVSASAFSEQSLCLENLVTLNMPFESEM